MANILNDCANKIVEKLMNLTIAESRYICCFKCIVEDFEKEKEELNAKWLTMQNVVEGAKGRAEVIQEDVKLWQRKAENLIEENTKTKMTCLSGWCPNCIRRYRRGKELAQKTKDIRTLKGIDFGCVGLAPNLPGVGDRSSQGYIHFESRDLGYKELLNALADDSNYMTGLQGMGGTGKTTMAVAVGKKVEESKQFDRVIFTTVSSTPNVKKIQDDIAAPFGLQLNDKSESERRKLLWTALTSGKKILIILDDVWESIELNDIGIPSGEDRKGCRVLITTRDLRICNSMGCSRPIQLGVLSEQDAWILFQKHAGINDNFAKNLQDKGREISKECKGLPVAIAAIASTLKGQQRLEEWNAALTALKKSMPMHDVDESLIGTYKCLRYSYDNTKSEKVKRLFLLCSLFPEDTEIDIEQLTRVSVGVGIFGEVDKYDEARNDVHRAKNKLIDSCLLLEAKEGYVKMHDLVREVALWIANKEIQFVIMSDKKRKALVDKESIRYLLCDNVKVGDIDVFLSWFDGTKLKILVLYVDSKGSVKDPNAFFKEMTRLRVLVLRSKGWPMKRLSLPQSIHSLTKIRSIIMRNWKLGDISILGALQSLETLDLVNCSISELPNKITELEKLRLLNLNGCRIESNNPFEVIGRCSVLEELYFKDNEILLLDNINNVEAIHLNREFPTLQRYHLDKDETDSSISKCVCLPNIDALISEATFRDLVRGAEILRLKEIKGEWRNIIPEIVQEDAGMNDLVELRLKSCSEVQCLIDTSRIHSRVQNVFPKLVRIKLKSMDNLGELCCGPFKSKLNLFKLKIMNLEGCPMLASLFQMSTARSLVLLEELRIHRCEQLTKIIADESWGDENEIEIVDGGNDHKSCDPMFPQLKILDIKGCHQLQCIFPVISSQDFPLLESIKIDDCEGLTHIFGQYQHDLHQEILLGSSKEMVLSSLPNFIDIFPESQHLNTWSVKRSSSILGFKGKQLDPNKCNILPWCHICCFSHKYKPQLQSATSTDMTMVSKDRLPKCSISLGLKKLDSKCVLPLNLSLILHSIRKIELTKFSKIKYLFSLSNAPTMLLEKLIVRECHELKHIIVDTKDDYEHGNEWSVVFPKLKGLYVYDCGQLEYMFGQYPHDGDQHCNQIHIHLPVLEEFTLENLPNIISIYPKSYQATWPSMKKFNLIRCPQFTVTSINDYDTSKTLSLECGHPSHTAHSLLRQSLMLCNIKVMVLQHCSKMTSLFTFAIAQAMLVEELTILECHEVKHVIADLGVDKNCNSVFPKLKMLYVSNCDQLECIFGQYHHEDQNHSLDFHIYLLTLVNLQLENLPNIINICHRNYHVTSPSLKWFYLTGCPQFHFMDSRQLDGSTTKGLAGIAKHFPTLKALYVENSKVESIFSLDARQQMNIALQHLNLRNLTKMTHICMGHKSSLTLQNLKWLRIEGCEKLEVIFPASISIWLPQLETLKIRECKELKHIIEEDDDVENWKLPNHPSSQPCFPKLSALIIQQCNKLKRLISVSACNVFPNLEFLVITEAPELEEVLGCEQKGDEFGEVKFELPKLKVVIFMQLPSLCQGIEFQNVTHRVVHTCPKLSLTSTASTVSELQQKHRDGEDFEFDHLDFIDVDILFYQIREPNVEPVTGDASKQGSTAEAATSDNAVGVEVEAAALTSASGSELPSSQVKTTTNRHQHIQNDNGSDSDALIASPNLVEELVDEQSRGEQSGVGETQVTTEIAWKNRCLKETEDQSIPKDSKSKKTTTAAPPTHTEITRNTSPVAALLAPQQSIKRSVEEGTSSKSAMTVTSSTHLEPASSLSGPLVTFQLESYPNRENMLRQIETYTDKESEGDLVNIQDFQDDDLISLFQSMEHAVTEDNNLVAKALADLEDSLKMPLKDIASSEDNSLHLLTALNFLSQLPLQDATLSDGLKAIIDSMRQEFPSIICSFKQAFAKEKSFKEEMAQRNKAKKFMNEAQQKEAILREQIIRLEKEIKDCKANLSSLPEEKEKCVAEIVGYKRVFENVRQELLQVNYKWSVMRSQFEHNHIAARNHPATKDNNLVAKVLADLEDSLKMPLKDIASFEDNSLRLLTSLNFLSELPLDDENLSDGLKAIIESLHQEFPSILCSFKQAFAKEESIRQELAQRENVAKNVVVSKVSKAEKFINEAEQKEAMLKEQINRLEKEIRDCEADLSSLKEEKKKYVAETIGYKKEFEDVRQELFEVNYKWLVLRSQFEHNRIVAGNHS